MTTSTMKLPTCYTAIDAEEMIYLDGGANNAYQSFVSLNSLLGSFGK